MKADSGYPLGKASNKSKDRRHDTFDHMCHVVFPDYRKGRLIAMLTAYLDESYNHRTEKRPNDPLVYTLGCWVSTTEKWKKFSRRWNLILDDAGIKWFHMAKFESRIGEYAEWSELKRINVLKRLHRAINDYTVYGMTSSVNCADYDELVTGNLRNRVGKTYYGFNVRMILKHLGEWADEINCNDSIHYVFAVLKGQGSELDTLYRDALRHPEATARLHLNGMWSKGIMQRVPQLQSADIVAYELNKRAVNHISNDPKFVRKSLNNLNLYENFAPLYFGKVELTKWISLLNRKRSV